MHIGADMNELGGFSSLLVVEKIQIHLIYHHPTALACGRQNESETPKLILLTAQQEGRPFQKVVRNASLDIPSCLPQRRLQLSLTLHGRQPQWLSSWGPVTQPASICISRSLCRKENEFLPVMQK